MDIKDKIKLGRFRNVNAVDVDNSLQLSLQYSNNIIEENDINKIIDVTEIFDEERQNIDIYRIHGQLQYFSITNNLRIDYETAADFLTRPFIGDGLERKDILTDFDFYIVKPIPPAGTFLSNGVESTGYVETNVTDRYFRDYEVIATPSNFDIYKAGFSKNIFDEQQFAFNVFGDINLTDQFDGLNFPLTEIYIYAVYRPQLNGAGLQEQIRLKNYDASGNTDGWQTFQNSLPILNIGDTVAGDVITYNPQNYSQTKYNEMEYQIKIPYDSGDLRFIYQPFIPIQVRVLSNEIQRVSVNSTDYQKTSTIPSYATDLGGGNYVWRDLLDKGFLDPLTNEGVNYPFFNQRHYVFINEVIDFKSDNDNAGNIAVLGNTIYGANQLIKNEPTSDPNSVGDKC